MRDDTRREDEQSVGAAEAVWRGEARGGEPQLIGSVDLEKHRLSLSIEAHNKEVSEKEEAEAIAEHAPKKASLGTLGDLLKKR